MPIIGAPLGLRLADLTDPAEGVRIDNFVLSQPSATPFHRPAWSRAVAAGCGQSAHCLVAERAGGQIAGILPMTRVSSPLFGRALVSTGFGVGGGILADEDGTAATLANAAWRLAAELGCPSVELRGGYAPGPEWQDEQGTYLGFSRDLAVDDAAELLAIPRKQRAEVRKSLDAPLGVTVGTGARDLDAHFKVYSESVRNLGTPVFPQALFRAVIAEFGNDADILTVWHEEVPVASVLSLYAFGTVYPYWGGGTRAARPLRANDHMYYALMSHARGRGCTRFDFGRSKAGTGPAAFKKNWGFEGVPMRYYRRTGTGQAPREINPLSPRYRLQVALWQRLPLRVANLLGPMISRGLG